MKRLEDFAHGEEGIKMFYPLSFFFFFLSKQQHRQVSAFRGNKSQNLPMKLDLLCLKRMKSILVY